MKKLDALFAEHSSPKHASRRQVHDQLGPMHQVVSAVQKQTIEYRALVSAIEFDSEGDGLGNHTEHMHQTFGAIEREAANMAASVRALAKHFTQLDNYMADAKKETAATQARLAAVAK